MYPNVPWARPIERDEQRHPLARPLELTYHLEGDDVTEAVSADHVRPLRLHGANLAHVVCRHLLNRDVRRRITIQSLHLKAIEWLFFSQPPGERLKVQDGASTAVHEEDGPP